MLPPGVVCDNCNNYFSRELEKPLLEADYFNQARFRWDILNKKGTVPRVRGIHFDSGMEIEISKTSNGLSVNTYRESDEKKFIDTLLHKEQGKLIIPIGRNSNKYLFSRFLGKVALEALALRVLDVPNGLDDVVNKIELDEIRNFVRQGNIQKSSWPFSERIIYPENAIFEENQTEFYVLHEFTFLYTEKNELYLILAIFGIEYAINLGGPVIEGYSQWLDQQKGRSPLYS